MVIKIEHDRWYVTKTGSIVGPAREVSDPRPREWALYACKGKIFEIVGVKPEQAFQTELVEDLGDHMNNCPPVEDRVATLEKVVVMSLHEECGDHDVFRVHSDLVLDSDVAQMVERVKRKHKET